MPWNMPMPVLHVVFAYKSVDIHKQHTISTCMCSINVYVGCCLLYYVLGMKAGTCLHIHIYKPSDNHCFSVRAKNRSKRQKNCSKKACCLEKQICCYKSRKRRLKSRTLL